MKKPTFPEDRVIQKDPEFDKIIQKENMKADAVAAGFMFLGHLLLVGFSDFFPNILPYFIVLGLFALAGFFFLGRVLIYKFKN